MLDVLDARGVPFQYVSYESDPRWVSRSPRVETRLWTCFPVAIDGGPFDLVIIDGPTGVTRMQWYPLLPPVVRPGTILLVDDYGHYPEFGRALDAALEHETVDEYRADATSGVTWKIVRVR